MALKEGYYSFDVDVCKWKVEADAWDLFGGVIQIRLVAANSADQYMEWVESGEESGEWKSVFFPKTSLGALNSSCTAGLLLRAALRQYPLLRCCQNLDLLATSVTKYMCCKYHFSPEILSGQGPYKPIITIQLLITLEEQGSPCRVVDGGGDLDKLCDKLIILGRDAKLVTSALAKCYSSKEETEDREEVEGNLVMMTIANDDDDGGTEEMSCPICWKRFVKYERVIRASCSHTFHPGCITNWLIRNDSCPMCRSACSVLL